MPYFEKSEFNFEKQDPETSSGRQQKWHHQTRLGVIIAANIIITIISRIKNYFLNYLG